MAMRHAITKYPNTNLIWYLDQNAYIMDGTKSIEEHVADTKRLESLMMKDYPVVPPDSIIKTFSHLRGTETDLIVTQDRQGLVADSLILRNGDWAKFFLETWFDPLYRSYNFQRAERHALVSPEKTGAQTTLHHPPYKNLGPGSLGTNIRNTVG
jgi:mannan polymerase II complex MNN11 subunit